MSTAALLSPPRGRVREVVTPEGVPLRFTLADAGERAGAFLIDLVFLMSSTIVLVAVTAFLAALGGGFGWAIGLVMFFVLRSFYFTFFECRPTGATPGKRALRLRVVDAHGGPLTAEAVFSRNLMREIEFFVPLVALMAPESLGEWLPGWARLLSLGWLLVFALLPLFNRDRLRAGDLVGGTLVVRAPRSLLLEDLSGAGAARQKAAAPAYVFTREQLDIYGIYELQVLEELLRSQGPVRWELLQAVSGKVQAKLNWQPPVPDGEAERFLHDFYTAQRRRLEQKMMLGHRQERKRAIRRP